MDQDTDLSSSHAPVNETAGGQSAQPTAETGSPRPASAPPEAGAPPLPEDAEGAASTSASGTSSTATAPDNGGGPNGVESGRKPGGGTADDGNKQTSEPLRVANAENRADSSQYDKASTVISGNPNSGIIAGRDIEAKRDFIKADVYENHNHYAGTGPPEETDDFRFEQVAARLPPEIRFPPDDDLLRRWVSDLCQKHLIVLSSYDGDVLFSAGKAVATAAQGASHESFIVPFHSCQKIPTRLARLLCNDEQAKPRLLVVQASDNQAALFLDPVIGEPVSFERSQMELQDNYLIVLTNETVLGWQADPETFRSRHVGLPYHAVPFLVPRLRHAFPGESERVRSLFELIEEQRKRGKWGAGEKEFYDEITRSLGHGQLAEEVEKKKDAAPGAAGAEPQPARADRLLSPSTPLENAVLFLVTFFPDLSMDDFERLLLAILGERTQKEKGGDLVLSADGCGRLEDKTRPLREIWAESFPEVLARCRLTTTASVVDFTLPELREILRKEFTGLYHPIYSSFFRDVRDRRLLFDQSESVVDATVRFFVEAALANPSWFSGPGLGGVIPRDGALLPVDRLYFFLRAFLQRPALRGHVARFMGELLAEKNYDALLKLVWSLWDVPESEPLRWVRRLLEEGTDAVRKATASRLWKSAHGGRGAQIMAALADWLPAPLSLPSPGQETVLSFLLELHAVALYSSKRKRTGSPLTHPLLASATFAEGSRPETNTIRSLLHPLAASRLRDLFQDHFARWIALWLIPPLVLPAAFDDPRFVPLWEGFFERWDRLSADPLLIEAPAIEALFFPSTVWADWAVELLSAEPPAPRSQALYERIIAALAEACEAPKRRALGILWSTLEEYLLDMQLFLDELDPLPSGLDRGTVSSLRRELQTRRRCVKQLRLDLQARGRAPKNSGAL